MKEKSTINSAAVLTILLAVFTHAADAGEGWNYYFKKAEIQFSVEKFAFAQENYERALGLNPALYEAANRLGEILMIKNQRREAYDYFLLSLSIKEDQPRIHNRAGELEEFFGYYEKSFAHYRRAVELDPAFREAHLNLVRHHVRERSYSLADEHYAISYRIGKEDGERYFSRAMEKEREGRRDEAVGLYNTALEKNPAMVEALFSLAELYRREGDTEKAVAHLEKIKEIRPHHERAHVFLGHLYYSRRYAKRRSYMLKQAVKNFEKALEINPDAAESWFMLSEIYRFMGDDVKAAHCHDRAAATEAPHNRGPSTGRE